MALTGPYIFLTDVFVRIAAARAYFTSRGEDGVSVEDLLGEEVTGAVRARQQSILEAALSVYRAHYALSDAPERHDSDEEELTTFRHALVGFGRATREFPGVAARYSLDKIARATAPSLHHDTHSFDKRRFREDLAQACLSTGMTNIEAQRTARAVATSTQRESSAARAKEALVEIRERMCAVRPRDLLAVCMVCVCWAAFQAVRPWLYWRGLERGQKDGCDVRLVWMFVPVSVYGKFEIWLKVWGVIMCGLGAVALCYGAVLLVNNLFAAGRWGRTGGLLSDVESLRSLLIESSSSAFSSAPSSVAGDIPCRATRPSRRCRRYFRYVAGLQFLVLVVMAGGVEGTIWVNDIDMTRGDLRTSSQLFALMVGLVTSFPVFWECLVIMPLRWMARKRARREGESRRWSLKFWAKREGESKRWSLKFWKRQGNHWGTDAEMTSTYL